MTAAEPLGMPGLPLAHLLTAREYAQLGETGWGYTELMEGRILVSPSPTAKHNMAGFALARQLHPQLPSTPRVIPDVDIDLRLVPADQPGLVRRPDLVVVESEAQKLPAIGTSASCNRPSLDLVHFDECSAAYATG